jgi:hypothetical protein
LALESQSPKGVKRPPAPSAIFASLREATPCLLLGSLYKLPLFRIGPHTKPRRARRLERERPRRISFCGSSRSLRLTQPPREEHSCPPRGLCGAVLVPPPSGVANARTWRFKLRLVSRIECRPEMRRPSFQHRVRTFVQRLLTIVLVLCAPVASAAGPPSAKKQSTLSLIVYVPKIPLSSNQTR